MRAHQFKQERPFAIKFEIWDNRLGTLVLNPYIALANDRMYKTFYESFLTRYTLRPASYWYRQVNRTLFYAGLVLCLAALLFGSNALLVQKNADRFKRAIIASLAFGLLPIAGRIFTEFGPRQIFVGSTNLIVRHSSWSCVTYKYASIDSIQFDPYQSRTLITCLLKDGQFFDFILKTSDVDSFRQSIEKPCQDHGIKLAPPVT